MTKLGDLCEINSGGTPSRRRQDYYNGSIPWAKISDIENAEEGILNDTEEHISEEGLESIGNRIFPKGTLLFAMYGSIGKVAITGRKISTNQAILGIRPKKDGQIHLPYLKLWFDKNRSILINQGRGVALKNLSASIVRDLNISLPSFEEQIRISDLLRKVEFLIAKRKRSLLLVDAFLRSTFLEMFGDPVRNTKKLPLISLGALGVWKSGGTPPRHNVSLFKGNIPWITSGELNQLYIDDAAEKITASAIETSNASIIQQGSLLLGMYDTAALKSSINTIPVTCNQAIAFSKLDVKKCNTLFVYYTIQIGKDHFKSQQRGVRQKNMNLSMIRGLKILYPSVHLQNKFAGIVGQIEGLKAHLSSSRYELENLLGSLSHKEFDDRVVKQFKK